MSELTRIPTTDLAVGMYVSELDRPWLETPFLFQGFYVKSDEDIAELRAHCEHVYVDLQESPPELMERYRNDRGSAAAKNGPEPSKEGSSARLRRLQGERDEPADAHEPVYRDSRSLKEEFDSAEEIRENVHTLVERVMRDLRAGRPMDAESVEVAVEPLVDSVLRNHDAMACLMRMKKADDYTYNHSVACSVWAAVFGRHIGLDRETLKIVAMGGMLLDVGKTRVRAELLHKPGPLTPEETAQMRRHVEHGVDIIEQLPRMDARVLDMVRHHHERHDGSGYPAGIGDSTIPVFGRIAGIVDAYDAMTTHRPYAPAKSPYDAMREFRTLAGKAFQAELVEQFVQAIGMFPTGTLVEMNTGEVGVVVSQNRVHRLRPQVMLILDADKRMRRDFPVRDLDAQIIGDEDDSLWIDRGLEPGAYGIDPAEYYAS